MLRKHGQIPELISLMFLSAAGIEMTDKYIFNPIQKELSRISFIRTASNGGRKTFQLNSNPDTEI